MGGQGSTGSLRLPFAAPAVNLGPSTAEFSKGYRNGFPLAGAGPDICLPVPLRGIPVGLIATDGSDLGRAQP